MTRLVILLLLFEFIYVKSMRVVDGNLIDTLDSLLDKVDKFELREDDKDFVESDVDYEVDLEKAEPLRMLTSEQVAEFNKAIQESGKDVDEDKGDKVDDGEDDIWPDDEVEYAMDGSDDWDADEEIKTSSQPPMLSPSLLSKPAPVAMTRYVTKVPVFVDPIAATNKKPRILNDSKLSEKQRKKLRYQVDVHRLSVFRTGQCSVPQPRWLRVRQLAPAADIVYSPSCVMLHRCAPDSGCCHNESEECAPIEGHYVSMPFILRTILIKETFARMEFYNHTRCGCVTSDAALHHATSYVEHDQTHEAVEWHGTEAPVTEFTQTKSMDVLENDEQPTEAPMGRCICPTLFKANMTDKGCKCLCDWPKNSRTQRDCLSLARGFEHFGMRDRECINQGVCNSPWCELGTYDAGRGTCPLKRSRWFRNKNRMEERQPSN